VRSPLCQHALLLVATGAPLNVCAAAFEFWKRVDDPD
jgi:hypothetical protein